MVLAISCQSVRENAEFLDVLFSIVGGGATPDLRITLFSAIWGESIAITLFRQILEQGLKAQTGDPHFLLASPEE